MSLLEALLLDPQRINTWVALRNDEVRGSGTQTDPYNVSPRFDPKVPINAGSGLVYSGTEATGYTESPSLTTPNLGAAMYIRDCFVDCGQTTLSNAASDKVFRGLSRSWCNGGLVEGNTVQNSFHGGPHNTLGTGDVAVGPLYAISISGTGSFRARIEGNRIELTQITNLGQIVKANSDYFNNFTSANKLVPGTDRSADDRW